MADTKTIDEGGPAFATPSVVHENGQIEVGSFGMSLRDWFAGKALSNVYTASEQSPDKAAEWAYQVADAMISARKAGA